jgi:hypothetical protein
MLGETKKNNLSQGIWLLSKDHQTRDIANMKQFGPLNSGVHKINEVTATEN